MGICQDRVVIVTGSGSGLGRSHALAFAAEGAKLVINDINVEAAQSVVDEIKAAGGEAIVNSSDITNYDDSINAVKQAIEAFGDLHVVVNNAGICRDRMFASMTEAEWDAVVAVHLKGHFCITSHAVHYWRGKSKEGNDPAARIINTSSGAGLQGAVGQCNYAAAKGGIASLTLVQGAELGRYGITANAIAPSARTGMTEGVFADMMKKPEEGFDHYDPANVAPLLVWLGSPESSDVTGQVFEVEGGKITCCDGWRTGPVVDKGDKWAPAEVGDAVRKIISEAIPPQKVFGS